MILWLIVLVLATVLVTRLTPQRWVRLGMFLVALLWPFWQAPVGIPLAKRLANELGDVRIFQRMEDRGFLHRHLRLPQIASGLLQYLQPPYSFEYVEVEFVDNILIEGFELEPGFYQFRLAAADTGAPLHMNEARRYCSAGSPCLEFTRTDYAVSCCAWEPWRQPRQVGPLAELVGVSATCSYVREITSNKELARECEIFWIPWWSKGQSYGPVWRYPKSPTSTHHNPSLEISDVVIPVRLDSN